MQPENQHDDSWVAGSAAFGFVVILAGLMILAALSQPVLAPLPSRDDREKSDKAALATERRQLKAAPAVER